LRGSSRRRAVIEEAQNRHKPIESDLAEAVTATIHPSAILRGEPDRREAEFATFVDDLRFAAGLL
jgi:hypothetical protein